MNKKFLVIGVLSALIIYASCYNNKSDVPVPPTVSFQGEILPIMTGSGCGCHNNVNANTSTRNAYPFTLFDTIRQAGVVVAVNKHVNTDGIIARVDTFRLWVNGVIGHPGDGVVEFTPNEKVIVKAWVDQGPPYDGGGGTCEVSSNVNYTEDIVPIYNSTCKSSGCHGGRGPDLTYDILVSNKSNLITMMNTAGASGHPGGTIGLSSCTVKTFQAWIDRGMPQYP